jgi:hypothetical protein
MTFQVSMRKCAFTGARMSLDGCEYVDCAFTNCVIVYAGAAPFNLTGCNFTNCKWEFAGAAAATVMLLQGLWASTGGRALVQAILGTVPTPAQGGGKFSVN